MTARTTSGESPDSSNNSTSLAGSIMVSSPAGKHSRLSCTPPTLSSDVGESNGPSSPSGTEQLPTLGRLESVRRSMQTKGISEEAFEIISSSWQQSTEKSYSSAWKKWLGWCQERHLDPFPKCINPVVEFLSTQFKQGYQYSTINTYRSALLATIPHVEGHPVGQHPLVCKLLQGIFNKRPPMPRYHHTWDVGVVVHYLKGLEPSEEQPLPILTKKLVTLLALANASCASDLHALDLQYHQFS